LVNQKNDIERKYFVRYVCFCKTQECKAMESEVRVILMMSPELRDKLRVIAKQDGRVLSRQIEHVLKEYVARWEQKE
jgi:hypothetical protein